MSDQGIIDTIAEWLGEVYGWCQECGIGQSDNRTESAQGIAAALRERYAIVELPEPLKPDDECSSAMFHAKDACMNVRVRMGEVVVDTDWYLPKEARSLAAALLAAPAAVEADQ